MASIKTLKLSGNLKSGEGTATVSLDDGTQASFPVAAASRPAAWAEGGFHFGPPTLFVRDLSAAGVKAAAAAMASCMGGFWLRYYKTRPDIPRSPLKVASLSLDRKEPPKDAARASAVAEATIADGRLFSILCATPARFEALLDEHALPFYFGPCILFVREMKLPLVKQAVAAMAEDSDRWLCRYDTPRTTLPEVFSSFSGR